jgi:hypothetical protein
MSNTTSAPIPIIEDLAFALKTFDALPVEIRRMMVNAPWDYSAEMIRDAWLEYKNQPQSFMDFISNASPKKPSDFARTMDQTFRRDVAENSYSGQETNGSYKLVPRVHAKSGSWGSQGYRGVRARLRRPNGIFPPIKTGRGTEINYG